MPSVIRQALAERISCLPALQEFLRDFAAATDVPVQFVSASGRHAAELTARRGALCALVQSAENGRRACAACVQCLLERARESPQVTRCDAGLTEAAVPLRAGGQTFGYFVIGGFAPKPTDAPERNRVRHLLELHGVALGAEAISVASQSVPAIGPDRQAALLRLLRRGAEQLVLAITAQLAAPAEDLPPLVREACARVRRDLLEEISLAALARDLGVSVPHFCRVFHHATGLRFREYVGRLRAQHARELLAASDRSITEIASATGFHSISQFNRIFRAVHGVAPREMRKQAEAGRLKSAG